MPRQAHPWFRRSDGWWYVKLNGRQTKLVQGLDQKAAALTRWHELMTERAKNPPLESPDQTVASVIDQFLTHAKRQYAASSYAVRLYYLQAFAEAHGFRLVRDCRPILLTAWLDAHPDWVSDWTRSHVVNVVQRPFNWAVREGIIAANPFRGVARRNGEPRRPLTDEEFRALLRATTCPRPAEWKRRKPATRPTAGARFRQVLLFLRYTGARPGEMAQLLWSDVDLDACVIILRRHKTSRTQRIPKPRVIPLVPVVVKLLTAIKRRQSPDEPRVFLTARRTPWNRSNLGLKMRRLRDRAKMPHDAKLYGIRHRFGTQSIVNGVDIKTLSELMGHTSTRMTEHYCHLAGQGAHLAAAMQRAVSQR